MLVEIPQFRRCCFCLPLRSGIIVFGWLTLIVTCLSIAVQVVQWMNHNPNWMFTVGLYRGVQIEAHMSFLLILYILDIVFNILLIVGAHMKNSKLLRIYFYYQLTTMVASLSVCFITFTDIHHMGGWAIVLTEIGVVVTAFVVQVYLLLLIRSELNKERYQDGRSTFINNLQEVFVEPPVVRDRQNLL